MRLVSFHIYFSIDLFIPMLVHTTRWSRVTFVRAPILSFPLESSHERDT